MNIKHREGGHFYFNQREGFSFSTEQVYKAVTFGRGDFPPTRRNYYMVADPDRVQEPVNPEAVAARLVAGNRLCMVMDVSDDFSLEAKADADRANPRVQQREQLMWKFQQALPFAVHGEKWGQMNRIFELPHET